MLTGERAYATIPGASWLSRCTYSTYDPAFTRGFRSAPLSAPISSTLNPSPRRNVRSCERENHRWPEYRAIAQRVVIGTVGEVSIATTRVVLDDSWTVRAATRRSRTGRSLPPGVSAAGVRR